MGPADHSGKYLTMKADVDGQSPANSDVRRMASGASSLAAATYPRRRKNASAVVVSR